MRAKQEKYNLWIGNELNPDDRLKIRVSDKDMERQQMLPRDATVSIRVKDLNTRKYYKIRRADCGLGCMCALELS